MLPDDDPRDRVRRFITAVSRRRGLLYLGVSVALAATAALVLRVGGLVVGAADRVELLSRAVALAVGLLAMVLTYRFMNRRASAAAIERAVPSCRNLVVTAEELERHPDRTTAAMTQRVWMAADAALTAARPADVVPYFWIAGVFAAAVAASVLSAPAGQRGVGDAVAAVSQALPALGQPPRVRVRIEPPAYSGRPAVTLDSPSRIDALEGSRLAFELRGSGRLRFGDAPVEGTIVARESGYFALEGDAADGGDRAPTVLIPLTVARDRVPSVRIEAPARDLLLPRGDRTIAVTIHAADDLALAGLELRYTKVSGTGEQFEFVEGTLPVRLERTSAREWRAAGELALPALRLDAGDSLVYRAVARDQRPGASGSGTSETYFVEIAGPGQIALEGVDMPPGLERYALSQQMIVLKIERLRARAAGMPRDVLAEEATGLAVEQRTVRANFVFLLGGHVEDEEAEAEQSHEIQEGRLENTARRDIHAAIGHMTRAEQGLAAVDPDAALPPARAAVESLQRAFGRSRYLLRALAVRSRLDPSRRLTGDADGAGSWRRVPPDAEPREGDAARRLLERLLEAAEAARAGAALPPRTFEALAESALAIDSTAAVWQEVAARLLEANDPRTLADVIARVAPEAARAGLPRTPLAAPMSPVAGAFQVERRR